MDKILLIKPDKNLKNQAIDYKQEHFSHGEFEINGSSLWDKTDDYEVWLDMIVKNSCKDTVAPNWSVTDTYFAIRENDYKIIGIIDFRHELIGLLKDFGHSGYSVRPTERKKGYATEMLKQLLEIAKNTGLNQMQLSCLKGNIPSIKTIINNGGVYERTFQYNEEEADVYIIKL